MPVEITAGESVIEEKDGKVTITAVPRIIFSRGDGTVIGQFLLGGNSLDVTSNETGVGITAKDPASGEVIQTVHRDPGSTGTIHVVDQKK